ncbi:hypothetical protein PTSG_02451 [Salpingoeca rosetta]|uniref:acylphosphatase n=1 Tax=Salpingoeca rosetta (strain ATCC 50818 / BSB-021) TaxID=946362 RepID=F2U287_SALR5|nr:uncharacterized protein PTSG_02451 [Salpingoeca rosetta]EGD81739.1 hypothetical protein PTSG_02451 [Salpingoeca rosetta]|eukprot:XP_004996943.1 hypothetical protein PTSG_02451 [Salpingoeca rosetta]
MAAIMERHLQVRGKVQGVMFRQTLMRAAQRLGLRAAASNMKQDKSLVKVSLFGDEDTVNTLVTNLGSGKAINSWGAKVSSIEDDPNPWPYDKHQVTTDNVDSKRWNPNVKMYL